MYSFNLAPEKKDEKKEFNFGLYDKSGRVCSLKGTKYDYVIQDSVLKKTIIQKFVNSNKKSLELEYKFATDETTTVYDVVVELFDPKKQEKKVLKAKVFGKEEAQERYDDAIAEGKTAMLAESDDDSSVSLSLGQVKPGIEVTINMQTVQELEIEKDVKGDNLFTMKVEIPSLNYSGGELSVKKNVDVVLKIALENGLIESIDSPSHGNEFESAFEKSGGFIKSKASISYNKDIKINVKVKDLPVVNAIVEKRKGDEEMYTTVVSFVPTLKVRDDSVMTELVIVVDCSGSMSGGRMRDARAAMHRFLKTLKYETQKIKINIIRFGSSFQNLYEKPKLLTKQNYNEVKLYIDETDSYLGGTNILDPIRGCLKKEVSENYTRQVFLLTDGEDSNTQAIIKYVRSHARTTRFFTFGIGNGINPVLINQVAKASNGRAVFIGGYGDSIEEKVIEQVKFATQPALTNINIKFPKGCKAQTVLKHVPACYNYQRVSQYFFSTSKPSAVKVQYSIGEVLNMDTVKPKDVTNDIGVLAARKRVLELEKYDESKTKNQKIRELGLKYNFLTTQTSFLMVDENDESEAIQDEMVSEKVAPIQIDVQSSVSQNQSSYSHQSYSQPQRQAYSQPSYSASSYSRPSRRRGFDISIPNPFSIGGCMGSDSTCVIIKNRMRKVVFFNDLKEGDMVESFNEKTGKKEFSKVIEVAHHESPRNVFDIELANEKHIKLTGQHLIPVCKTETKDATKFTLTEAKKVDVGDFVLVSTDSGELVPSEVVKITKGKDMVSCVYTMNGSIMCNGIACSVHVSGKLFKGPFYYKKLMHSVVPKKFHFKFFRKFFHYVFVHEQL